VSTGARPGLAEFPVGDVVDVAVLGPVGLLVGAVLVVPSSQAMRMLLGLLALAPGRELTDDSVAARIWGDRPRTSSRSALPVAVHRLRRWLADTAGDAVAVTRTATGYRLDLTRGDTDLGRFERLVAEAETAEPGERAALLERALSLWRGRPLADLPDHAVDPAAVAELEHHRRTARIRLARALLPTAADRAAGLLTPVARENPLDEELHGVLIEALAASGDQVGALNTYERLRVRLADELGVDPSGDLQRIYLRTLHQELRSAEPDEDEAGVLAQLPSAPAGFTGRDDALRRLDKLVHEAKADHLPMVAAVVGMAGVGKTSLALRWAHQMREEFPDGQLYLNLRGHSPGTRPVPARAALGQLLRSLGLPSTKVPADEDEAAAEFRSRAAGRRLLIVLDNARTSEQVRPLLPGSPSCCTLITSRDQLSGLVARNGARRVRLDVLPAEDAERLLARMLARMLGDRAYREPAAITELAALCGLLPLALRIAAANLDNQPAVSVASQVGRMRRDDLLGALEIPGDTEARVRAAFDVSFDALSVAAQGLFRLLGHVPGADVTTGAAAALAGLPVSAVRGTLGELVAAHLLERHDADRFGWHDLLGQYARERAADLPAAEPVRRLVEWYLRSADAAVAVMDPHWVRLPVEPGEAETFADRGEALAWLDAERANIVATVEHATGPGPREAGWRLANAVAGYLELRAHTADAYTVATVAAEAAGPDAPPLARAALRLDLARVCQRLSHYDEAIRHGEQTVALSTDGAWPAGESSALGVLAVVFGELGRYDAGFEHATRAWRISSTHGLASLEGWQLNDLGIAHLWVGNLGQAAENFTRAREIHRETGAVAGENLATISLAQLSLEAGRLDDAIGYLATASELVRREGEILGWPRIFNTLAAVHCAAGRYSEAVDACRTALPVAERTADRVVRSSLLNNLGDALFGLGRYPECADAHTEALELAGQTGLVRHQGGAFLGLARCFRATGDLAKAREYAERAVRLERASLRLWRAGQALTELATCALAAGDAGEATQHAEEAVRIHHDAGHHLAEARAREILAQVGK
jgi:DNA-binding SARP family transcriptional activator/tetratricopeptide (TPR) repeat protein